MDSGDAMAVLQIVAMIVSIVVGIAGQSWLIIRYLMKRQDDGDNKLHDRISEVRNNSVPRSEYEKDVARMDSHMSRIEHEVRNQGHSMTARLDTLITHFVKGPDK